MTEKLSLSPFDRMLGLQLSVRDGVEVVGSIPLREDLKQPHGLAHGGLFACLAETAASEGTNAGVCDRGMIGLGSANNTSFLKPIAEGTIHVSATVRHRGRSTWVCDVERSGPPGTRLRDQPRDGRRPPRPLT